jgi:hypothetical protein
VVKDTTWWGVERAKRRRAPGKKRLGRRDKSGLTTRSTNDGHTHTHTHTHILSLSRRFAFVSSALHQFAPTT